MKEAAAAVVVSIIAYGTRAHYQVSAGGSLITVTRLLDIVKMESMAASILQGGAVIGHNVTLVQYTTIHHTPYNRRETI